VLKVRILEFISTFADSHLCRFSVGGSAPFNRLLLSLHEAIDDSITTLAKQNVYVHPEQSTHLLLLHLVSNGACIITCLMSGDIYLQPKWVCVLFSTGLFSHQRRLSPSHRSLQIRLDQKLPASRNTFTDPCVSSNVHTSNTCVAKVCRRKR
jgi:hypothetical protein